MKKRKFSLLEMFLVLALLGILTVWIGPRAFTKIQKHRFHHQIEKIQEKFLFLQKNSVLTQRDLFLTLYSTKKGVKMVVFVEEGEKLFSEKSQEEEFFKNLFFTYEGKKVKKKKISFFSSGLVGPLGEVSFFDSSGNKVQINLEELLGFSLRKKTKVPEWAKDFYKKELSGSKEPI